MHQAIWKCDLELDHILPPLSQPPEPHCNFTFSVVQEENPSGENNNWRYCCSPFTLVLSRSEVVLRTTNPLHHICQLVIPLNTSVSPHSLQGTLTDGHMAEPDHLTPLHVYEVWLVEFYAVPATKAI